MKEYLEKFDKWLEGVFKQTPKLPDGFRKFLVDVAPWLALLGGVMGIFGLLSALSLGGFVGGMAYAFGYRFGVWYWLNLVVLLAMTIVDFKAYKPLKERKMEGWKLMWYVSVFGLIQSVVVLNPMSVVMSAVGFYLLYQVRGMYK